MRFSAKEIQDIKCLEEILKEMEKYPGSFVDPRKVLANLFPDLEGIRYWTESAISNGLLEQSPIQFFVIVRLSWEGQRLAYDARAKRDDTQAFMKVIRERLLWLTYERACSEWEQFDIVQVLPDDNFWFYGRTINYHSWSVAAKELVQRNLIVSDVVTLSESTPFFMLHGMTADGMQCVSDFDCDTNLFAQYKNKVSPAGTIVNIETVRDSNLAMGNHNRMSTGAHWDSPNQ